MLRWILALSSLVSSTLVWAQLPKQHTELLPYVQEAPDQGDTATCLFMGTTGAVELLLNQKYNIQYPKAQDLFDLSERFAISHSVKASGHWIEQVLPKFNQGWSIHHSDLPFEGYKPDGSANQAVWSRPSNFYQLPRLGVSAQFKTTKIFARGKNKYSKYVATPLDLVNVKKALVEYNAPVLINYNHNGWWHVVNIVGFDDEAQGDCLHTPAYECKGQGAFYVRDSLGKATHLRDYDWFRVNVNTAFVVTLE
jgi:C1A family cysteine protease